MSLRRVILACLLIVAGSLIVGTGAAVAGPREVVADYWADGDLDANYTLAELRGALRVPDVQGGSYDAFRDLVNAEIIARVVGGNDRTPGSSNRSAPPDKGSSPPERPGGSNEQAERPAGPPEAPLGEPPAPPAAVAQNEDLPVAFIALAAVAALLVVVGGGTAMARRLRRR